MAEFACFIGGQLREMRTLPARPDDIAHKNIHWYPVERRTASPASASLANGVYVVVTPVSTPDAVSMRQCRIALARAGKLAAVQSAIEAAGGETAITWDYATTVERASPLVSHLAAVLGMSSGNVDALFRTASAV